jgi:YVTN family beta-propeller protein
LRSAASHAASRFPPTVARLYISDQDANSLVVYDTEKQAELAKDQVGESPEAIYLSPDGRLALRGDRGR